MPALQFTTRLMCCLLQLFLLTAPWVAECLLYGSGTIPGTLHLIPLMVQMGLLIPFYGGRKLSSERKHKLLMAMQLISCKTHIWSPDVQFNSQCSFPVWLCRTEEGWYCDCARASISFVMRARLVDLYKLHEALLPQSCQVLDGLVE